MSFHANPQMKTEDGQTVVKRYVHQPLTNTHFGIQFSIKENGRVIIRSAPTPVKGTDEVEYEEVDVPASLIFKLATLLKATRQEIYIPLSEAKNLPADAADAE